MNLELCLDKVLEIRAIIASERPDKAAIFEAITVVIDNIGLTKPELASAISVAPQTVYRWYSKKGSSMINSHALDRLELLIDAKASTDTNVEPGLVIKPKSVVESPVDAINPEILSAIAVVGQPVTLVDIQWLIAAEKRAGYAFDRRTVKLLLTVRRM